MTDQQGTSALAFITRLEASRMARVMAAVRLGIGAIGLLAPGRLAWRLFVQGQRADEATVMLLRAGAGRDLALGLGMALASKRGPVRFADADISPPGRPGAGQQRGGGTLAG